MSQELTSEFLNGALKVVIGIAVPLICWLLIKIVTFLFSIKESLIKMELANAETNRTVTNHEVRIHSLETERRR